jgi:hypothetical protein
MTGEMSRKRCCHTLSCRRTTTSNRATSSLHGSVAPGCSGRARSADFPDLPAWGRARFAHLHGALYRFRDPTRISLARCGKDRHPFPVPIKVYDDTIRVMNSASGTQRLDATRRCRR